MEEDAFHATYARRRMGALPRYTPSHPVTCTNLQPRFIRVRAALDGNGNAQ